MPNSSLTKDQIEDLLHYIGAENIGQWKGNNIQFCCPVHHEVHPSAGICCDYTPKDEVGAHYQVYNCFSCGCSGSLPWLLFKSMPDDFKSVYDAEQFLAERYGVDYGRIISGLKTRRVQRFGDVDKKSIGVYRKELPMAKIAPFKSGKATYKYFFQRGFDKQDLKDWKIGRDLENRTVTIPAFWSNGNLAGVIGRYIDPDRPKNMRYKIYDFQKSSLIFPENKLEVIDDTIIGVEGMFDCIMLHKWGRPNTISIMGNKMSKAQADYIAAHCKKFISLWDNDDGGIKAEQIARKLLSGRVDYFTCDYSDVVGKDPSEWGELQTNKILSTASLLGRKSLKRL